MLSLITGWQMETKGSSISEVLSKISRRDNLVEMDPSYSEPFDVLGDLHSFLVK